MGFPILQVDFQGYIHAKYLNLKVTMIENDDKKCRRCAEKDLWGYLHKRMRVNVFNI